MGRLGIGSVQFGQAYGISNTVGQVPRAEVKLILELAGRAGVALLDTAANYGEAEAVLGVVDAADRRQLHAALAQLAGGISRPLQQLRDDFLNLLAGLEAGLDFV